MKKDYHMSFIGREKGAIGCTYEIHATVNVDIDAGESIADALLDQYDTVLSIRSLSHKPAKPHRQAMSRGRLQQQRKMDNQ